MLDTIESNVVYDHEKHGEVLVTAVGEMYSEYPLTGGRGEPDPVADSKLVYYYQRFDGYGGMAPTPLTQRVGEFAKHAKKIRPHERVDTPLSEE